LMGVAIGFHRIVHGRQIRFGWLQPRGFPVPIRQRFEGTVDSAYRARSEIRMKNWVRERVGKSALLVRIGHQKMLPAVVFDHQVAIARLLQPALEFQWKFWLGIHVILDRTIFANQRFELGLPALHQKTNWDKITLRLGLHE